MAGATREERAGAILKSEGPCVVATTPRGVGALLLGQVPLAASVAA